MLKLLIRLGVSAAILALIFRTVDIQQIVAVVREANLPLLAAATAAQLASNSLAAWRWRVLMHNLKFGQSIGFYWRSYLKGSFFNQGLPSSIGGDALRVLDVARQGFRKRDALFGVMLDRAVGLASLLLLNLVAFGLGPQVLPAEILYLALGAAAATVLIFTGAWHVADFLHTDGHPQLARVRRLSLRLRRAFARQRTALFASSMVIHVIAMLCVYLIGTALGLDYDLLTYLMIVPPAILLTVIPISLAGWGVREGALVALFSFIGADAATVLAMSLIYGLTLAVASTPGFIVYLQDRQRVV